MRKRIILTLAVILTLLLSPAAALASEISGARFKGLIQVLNSGGAATHVATTCNISTQNLIDGGYLSSSANNCVIRSGGVDLEFMPGINGNPWGIWVESIGAGGVTTDFLYTAESSGGKLRYFPGDAGMSAVDSLSLELGDNFSVTQSGWWDTDTGENKNGIIKPGAFRIYISAHGSITAEVTDSCNVTATGINPGEHVVLVTVEER